MRSLPRAGRRQPNRRARRPARGSIPWTTGPPGRQNSPRQGRELYPADNCEHCTADDTDRLGAGRDCSRHQGFQVGTQLGGLDRSRAEGGLERRPGSISKPGDRYLRYLLVSGAMAVIRRHRTTGFAGRPWLARLVETRPLKVTAMALANRITTIAWALLSRGERYRDPVLRTAWWPAPHRLGRSNDVMPERVEPGIG